MLLKALYERCIILIKGNLFNVINKYLPVGSEIIVNEINSEPLIINDQLNECESEKIIVFYRWQEENYIILLERFCNQWSIIDNIKGKGYGVSYFKIAPITDNGINNLIVGWRRGSMWSELDILQFTSYGFTRVIEEGIYYSKIEVENMKNKKNVKDKNEIALWLHDTKEAYKIEIYRWNLGKLVKAEDVYPYYFKRVIEFYKKKVKEDDNFSVYWYYLVDAQIKGNKYEDALESINRALKFTKPYPSKKELLKLKDYIYSKMKL